ncbi:MAG: hypothetical protein ACI4A3_11365 [Lachnospiraceae bacterium]
MGKYDYFFWKNKIHAERNSVCIILLLLLCLCFVSGCQVNEEKQTVKSDVRDFESVDCIESTNPEYAAFLEKVNNYYEKCGFNGCFLVAGNTRKIWLDECRDNEHISAR